MTDSQLFKFLTMQYATLREEAIHLKNCQLRYFTITVIAVATIFGINTGGIGSENYRDDLSLFLVPLLIIIPNWWLMFDKAKSISRIVGFQRIVEERIYGDLHGKFLPWEMALQSFRSTDGTLVDKIEHRKKILDSNIKPLKQLGVLFLITKHKYWVINYHLYFISAALCLYFSSPSGRDRLYLVAWGLVAMLCLVTAWFNGRLLFRLSLGHNSYDGNNKIWKIILKKKGRRP